MALSATFARCIPRAGSMLSHAGEIRRFSTPIAILRVDVVYAPLII
jgi:hypothetical protein